MAVKIAGRLPRRRRRGALVLALHLDQPRHPAVAARRCRRRRRRSLPSVSRPKRSARGARLVQQGARLLESADQNRLTMRQPPRVTIAEISGIETRYKLAFRLEHHDLTSVLPIASETAHGSGRNTDDHRLDQGAGHTTQGYSAAEELAARHPPHGRGYSRRGIAEGGAGLCPDAAGGCSRNARLSRTAKDAGRDGRSHNCRSNPASCSRSILILSSVI